MPEKITERAGMLTPWKRSKINRLLIRGSVRHVNTYHGKSFRSKENLDQTSLEQHFDNLRTRMMGFLSSFLPVDSRRHGSLPL